MNIKNVILGLIAITLPGCDTNEVSPARLFIKTIENPATTRKDVFEYADGHLVTLKTFYGEREADNTQFHYLDNRLIKIESKWETGLEQIIELTYGENNLRQTEKVTGIYDGTVAYTNTATFSYDNGILKSIKETYGNPNIMPKETLFEWENGNITKMNFAFFGSSGKFFYGGQTMSYDNKRNYSNQDIAFIYTSFPALETVISKNNVIAAVGTSGNTITDRGSYKFTYNSSGYPNGYTYKVDSQEFDPVQISYE